MSNLISLYVDGHSANSCFADVDAAHLFNPTDFYRGLKNGFEDLGFELNTFDLNVGRSIVAELHIEGRTLSSDRVVVPRFLLAYENPIINPLNSSIDYFSKFDAIVTWNPKMQGLGNVQIKMLPNAFKKFPLVSFKDRPLLVSLINANKSFRNEIEGDLYKERLKFIRYCEKNCLELFGLYGRGWDKPTPSYRRAAKLKRTWIRMKTKLFGFKVFPSYRGAVKEKNEIYSRSKFAICYENFSNLENYITEKIFDAFFSGCVPVYWGAPNISDYIPAQTFIDRRRFSSDAELINFLRQLSEKDYREYQENIINFLHSDKSKIFELNNHISDIAQSIKDKIISCRVAKNNHGEKP